MVEVKDDTIPRNTDNAGKPKRTMVYGKTRAEVRTKMDKVRERLTNVAAVKDSKSTLADWFAHWRSTTLAVIEPQGVDKGAPPWIGRLSRGWHTFKEIWLDDPDPSHIKLGRSTDGRSCLLRIWDICTTQRCRAFNNPLGAVGAATHRTRHGTRPNQRIPERLRGRTIGVRCDHHKRSRPAPG